MDVRDWRPAVVASNKFERQILSDLLRNAGVTAINTFAEPSTALDGMRACRADIVIVAIEGESCSLELVRQLRRAIAHPARKAPVFMITSFLTMALAENCRHAGANAIIGKPVSTATLINTIRKVLAQSRPFVEAANYVGPCRRAGIVKAGTGARRRQADATP